MPLFHPSVPGEPHVPDYVPSRWYKEVLAEEQARLSEAQQCFEESVWHASNVSSATWPKSLHVLPGEDGADVAIVTRDKVVSGAKCIQVVANIRTIDAITLDEIVEAHDFIFLESLGHVACKTTRNTLHGDPSANDPARGPIIYRANQPRVVAGPKYSAPRLIKHAPKGRALSIFGVMETTAKTQLLATWLGLVTAETYEQDKSQSI